MNKRSIIILALMLALMLAVTACGASGAQPGSSPAQDDDAVSFGDFTTTDLDGNTVDQSIFAKAKLTMVNIWGTFCDPCISEMPELAEINDELAKDGVQVIGIVVNAQDYEGNLRTEIIETAKEIIELTGADYLHLLPSADLNRIKLDSVMSIPETVFVDSNGNLVGESYVGSRSKDKWLTIINTLLGQVSDELAVVPGCCA